MSKGTGKHATGKYTITIFDEYGTKIEQMPANGFTVGRAEIERHTKANPGTSGILTKVLYNSVDFYKWAYSPTKR